MFCPTCGRSLVMTVVAEEGSVTVYAARCSNGREPHVWEVEIELDQVTTLRFTETAGTSS